MKMHYQMRKNIFRERLAQANRAERLDFTIKYMKTILLVAYLLYSVVTDTLIIGAGTYFWLKGWPF
jgi:hypothetical protein